jgi:hypothetical protein
VLATVKTAARRLRRWPSASPDRNCAQRRIAVRPGQGNASQPNKETSFRKPIKLFAELDARNY